MGNARAANHSNDPRSSVSDTDNFWVWNGSTCVDGGSIQGAQGQKGALKPAERVCLFGGAGSKGATGDN